jgi:hypothetical protein
MVTAEKDVVLTPEMSKHMENWVREQDFRWVSGENTGVQRETAVEEQTGELAGALL